MAEANAIALGTPKLAMKERGSAIESPRPDAVCISGNFKEVTIEALWPTIRPAGCLVANAATGEAIGQLERWHAGFGGELVQLSHRALPDGQTTSIVQWRLAKRD